MLETQLERLRIREKEAQELLKQVKAGYNENRLSKDQRLAQLQAENASLMERLADVSFSIPRK